MAKFTAEEIRIANESWEKVRAIDRTFETQGVILFRKIFEHAPEALALFSFKDEPDLYDSVKLKRHGEGVFKFIDNTLADLSGMTPEIGKLGERHYAKGVRIPHFKVVGKSLLETLKEALGDEFTFHVLCIWTKIYGVVSGIMQGSFSKD